MHKGLNSLCHKIKNKSENTIVIIIKQMKFLNETLYSKII